MSTNGTETQLPLDEKTTGDKRRCVFVANINKTSSNDEVKSVLSQAGTVTKLKFMYDNRNGRKKGYAHCFYEDEESVQKAIDMLNDYDLDGRPMCVKLPRELTDEAPPAKKKNKKKNTGAKADGTVKKAVEDTPSPSNLSCELHISGLPATIDSDQLKEMLSTFGSVLSARIMQIPGAENAGYALATMASREQCDEVIATFSGAKLPDSEDHLTVKYSEKKVNRKRSRASSDVTAQLAVKPEEQLTLYLSCLQKSIDSDQLAKLCAPHGTVNASRILYNAQKQSRGVGFVDMTTRQECEALIAAFDGLEIPESTGPLSVKFAVRKVRRGDANSGPKRLKTSGNQSNAMEDEGLHTLYISGLPHSLSEPDLKEMFSTFGHVISARVMRDKFGASRGIGFIDMSRMDECNDIIQVFNGTSLPDSDGKLIVKLADRSTVSKQGQSMASSSANVAAETTSTNATEPKLYITGLPERVQKSDMSKLLAAYGNVTLIRVSNRGWALVTMQSVNQCKKAINALHGTRLPGARNMQNILNVKFAGDQTKGDTRNRGNIGRLNQNSAQGFNRNAPMMAGRATMSNTGRNMQRGNQGRRNLNPGMNQMGVNSLMGNNFGPQMGGAGGIGNAAESILGMVTNEQEAQMALDMSNQLTQALMKYRMNHAALMPGMQMNQGVTSQLMAASGMQNQSNWQNQQHFTSI